MPAWTDVTLVRRLVKQGSGALSDVEINQMCDNAEGYLKAAYKITSTFSFDATKRAHLILRDAATRRAAMDVIASTLTLSIRTLNEATTMLDVYRDLYNDCIGVLNSKADVVGFLEEEAD